MAYRAWPAIKERLADISYCKKDGKEADKPAETRLLQTKRKVG